MNYQSLFSLFFICLSLSLFSQDNEWEAFKKNTLAKMTSIPGWCTSEKALLMMDVIKENECEYCVEIGVFAGKSLFPIAKAVQYHGRGQVFAIDAWNSAEAIKGFDVSDPNFAWWEKLDFNYLYQQTVSLINNNKLNKFCTLIKQSSHSAEHLFANETIDFLHLDGNHNERWAFQDLSDYFPKVKDGGYILLNDPNWTSMSCSLVFLLERTELLSVFSPSATYFLFRKNNQREDLARLLFNY